MNESLTVSYQVAFASARPQPLVVFGRVPRLTRLMSLAIRFEGLVRSGAVPNYASLARLGKVTRARITQIMNMTLLAPDIQEEVLFLPLIERGRDRLPLRLLQPIALTPDWAEQRRRWAELCKRLPPLSSPNVVETITAPVQV